jgi:hypothetical protein
MLCINKYFDNFVSEILNRQEFFSLVALNIQLYLVIKLGPVL